MDVSSHSYFRTQKADRPTKSRSKSKPTDCHLSSCPWLYLTFTWRYNLCPIDIHRVPAKSDRKFSSMYFEVTKIPWWGHSTSLCVCEKRRPRGLRKVRRRKVTRRFLHVGRRQESTWPADTRCYCERRGLSRPQKVMFHVDAKIQLICIWRCTKSSTLFTMTTQVCVSFLRKQSFKGQTKHYEIQDVLKWNCYSSRLS